MATDLLNRTKILGNVNKD